MKRFSTKLGIYLPLILIATVLAVAFRTTATLSGFDFENGTTGLIYYKSGALIAVANWTAVAAIVFSLGFIFIARGFNPRVSFDSPLTYVPSGAVATALIFISANMLYAAREAAGSIFSREALAFPSILLIILAVLGVAAAVNFSINLFSEKARDSARAAFSILTTLFLAGYAAFLYFDSSLPKNAPTRIVDEMAYLFASVFFLYETRISLGRRLMRAYVSFGLSAMLLCAYSSIPTLIVYLSKGVMISHSLAECVLTLSLFVYILLRLSMLLFSGEDRINPITEAIEALAKERQTEILERREELRARDINIMVENSEQVTEAEGEKEPETLPFQETLDIPELQISESENYEE
jgi:hypothetical protein